MTRLVDDWEPQRQPCIDVLCAYVRMPYDPEVAGGIGLEHPWPCRGGRGGGAVSAS